MSDFENFIRHGDSTGLEPAPRCPIGRLDFAHSPQELRDLASRYKHQAAVLLSSAETCERRAAEIENRTRESKLEHARTNGAGE